ncbi:hypothetical protein Tco_0714560 [Tanacetum coccineum]
MARINEKAWYKTRWLVWEMIASLKCALIALIEVDGTVVEGTVRDRTVGLGPVSTKIVLLGLKGIPLTSRFIGCLEQDELPSSIELDFRARLGGGRDPLIAQDSSAVEVTKLTTGRLVNGSSCDGIDMVIENLDLEPKESLRSFAVLSGERLKQESVVSPPTR